MSLNQSLDVKGLIDAAGKGINFYLDKARGEGKITDEQYDAAKTNSMNYLSQWLNDPKIDELSPN
ncbi:MAG: hypothetical protein DWQ10_12930, partial [Calditrichaeota bacterium]